MWMLANNVLNIFVIEISYNIFSNFTSNMITYFTSSRTSIYFFKNKAFNPFKIARYFLWRKFIQDRKYCNFFLEISFDRYSRFKQELYTLQITKRLENLPVSRTTLLLKRCLTMQTQAKNPDRRLLARDTTTILRLFFSTKTYI